MTTEQEKLLRDEVVSFIQRFAVAEKCQKSEVMLVVAEVVSDEEIENQMLREGV